MTTHRTVAVIITKTENGYSILDTNSKVHSAEDIKQLGEVCHQILVDPTLPEYEIEASPDDLPTRFAQAVIPENFSFIAKPAVEILKTAVNKINNKINKQTPSKIRSTEKSRQEGLERAKHRRAEKDRLKELAREAARERRKMPHLPSLRKRA